VPEIRYLVIALVIIFLIISEISLAWWGHDIFTFLVVTSIPGFDYNKYAELREYNYVEKRNYKSGKYSTEELLLNKKGELRVPDELSSSVHLKTISGISIPVWMILTEYVTFPDNGMDMVPGAMPIELFIGETQANRHGYVKIQAFEFFEGNKSFVHFMDLSRQAFLRKDFYWGYRFFAYSLHYLEDLMQPYHVRPGTVPEMIVAVFDKNTRKMLTNAHELYDMYLEYLMLFSKNKHDLLRVIRETKPIIMNVPDDRLIYEAIVYSYSNFFKVHNEIKKIFGSRLYESVSMKDFVDKENSRELDNLYEITCGIVQTMAGVIKGLILKIENTMGGID
jgi:hypothetical protein